MISNLKTPWWNLDNSELKGWSYSWKFITKCCRLLRYLVTRYPKVLRSASWQERLLSNKTLSMTHRQQQAYLNFVSNFLGCFHLWIKYACFSLINDPSTSSLLELEFSVKLLRMQSWITDLWLSFLSLGESLNSYFLRELIRDKWAFKFKYYDTELCVWGIE